MNIGIPSVSRLTKAKRWFLNGDEPKLPTHDYPRPFKIVPSVYLQLQFNGERDKFEVDELSMLL